MTCYHTLRNQVIFAGFLFFTFFLCVADFEHDKIELLKLTKKKGTIITDITDSLNSDKIKRYIKFARI